MRLLDLTRRRSFTLSYALVTGLAALAGALALPVGGLDGASDHFWWVALGSVAIAVTLIARSGLWTATGAYAAVFWCFHFGLITVLALGLVEPLELSLWDQLWLMGAFGSDAAVLALLGLAAFAAGAALVHRSARRLPWEEPVDPSDGAHPHGTAGSLMVFGAVALWCGTVLATSGVDGFFGSYGDYLNATAEVGGFLSFVWLALGCGLVLAVTGARTRLRTAAIAAFAGVALLALPLGLRGEIMFPSVAALVAAARRGWVLSAGKACGFVLALLVLIPSVREVRNTGLQGLPDMVLELRLFDAFVEMGGSLHPVEKVFRWRAEGDTLALGASYWAPIERAAARVLPGIQTTAPEDDMRIMNVLVTDRVGAIGFSPVAEAYRNFGASGVVLVLGLLGAMLASMDRIANRRLAVLAIAALYVPLLTNVRNSFVSVPMQCLLGILLIVVLDAMQHVSASIRCKPYARAPYIRSEI